MLYHLDMTSFFLYKIYKLFLSVTFVTQVMCLLTYNYKYRFRGCTLGFFFEFIRTNGHLNVHIQESFTDNVQNKIIGKTKIIVLNIIRVINPWSK